ncbi:hypothetical protein BC828DRAFT_378024 [Blastocladiella britannica]|nr:hypothetical protein BC828DRAFT_378024 [Blastocladiella britannica]
MTDQLLAEERRLRQEAESDAANARTQLSQAAAIAVKTRDIFQNLVSHLRDMADSLDHNVLAVWTDVAASLAPPVESFSADPHTMIPDPPPPPAQGLPPSFVRASHKQAPSLARAASGRIPPAILEVPTPSPEPRLDRFVSAATNIPWQQHAYEQDENGHQVREVEVPRGEPSMTASEGSMFDPPDLGAVGSGGDHNVARRYGKSRWRR